MIVGRIMWTQSTSMTDRQTDRQTEYDHKDRAMHIASDGKNCTWWLLLAQSLLYCDFVKLPLIPISHVHAMSTIITTQKCFKTFRNALTYFAYPKHGKTSGYSYRQCLDDRKPTAKILPAIAVGYLTARVQFSRTSGTYKATIRRRTQITFFTAGRACFCALL